MPNPTTVLRFDEIFDSTKKTVLAYITAKCGHTANIHDIVQETYMELYKVLRKRGADYVKNERAFVLRLAKQKINRHYTLTDRLIGCYCNCADDSNCVCRGFGIGQISAC